MDPVDMNCYFILFLNAGWKSLINHIGKILKVRSHLPLLQNICG